MQIFKKQIVNVTGVALEFGCWYWWDFLIYFYISVSEKKKKVLVINRELLLQSNIGCNTHASKGRPAMERTFFRGTLALPPLASTSPQTWQPTPDVGFPLPSISLIAREDAEICKLLSHLSTFLLQSKPASMFTWILLSTCILDCLRKLCCCKNEDAELVGLSAAKRSALPPSTGGNIRKFQHGFRPLGRSDEGKARMSHEQEKSDYNSSNISNEMAESRRKRLQELVKKLANSTCAECGKNSKFCVCKHWNVRSHCFDTCLLQSFLVTFDFVKSVFFITRNNNERKRSPIN